jgi:hypothetical protein
MNARSTMRLSIPILISTMLCGCGTATISRQHEIDAAPVGKPATIYVTDFDLETSNIKFQRSLLPLLPKLPGLSPFPGAPKNPEARARDVVDSMSIALVKDLTKAGFTASRLGRGGRLPASGWLVRGVFTHIDEGHQLSRALIGFGAGKTDVQLIVHIDDLSQGGPRPFYELHGAANSGKAPGAGPTIVLGPAGTVARFVIAGRDLDRNVEQTASKIAATIVERTRKPFEPAQAGNTFRNTEALF